MMMRRSPSHFVVWPNSTSNAFPVGAITLPLGRTISPLNVPVARVTTVIQSPLPNWIGYGVYTCLSCQPYISVRIDFSYWSGVNPEDFDIRSVQRRVIFSFKTENRLFAIFGSLGHSS
jgi:hypothetical protein